MKGLNRIFVLLLMSFIMISFSQCSSAQKLQKESPVTLGEVYCQSWIGGIEGGGSGINIFIPVEDTSVIFDSVYFRGKAVKLVTKPQNTKVFIGYFISDFNKPKNMDINSQSDKEQSSKMRDEIEKKLPFELKENQCVVSYKEGKTTKYFKINNVLEKESTPMMSAPPNKN